MYSGLANAVTTGVGAYADVHKANGVANAGLTGEEQDANPWYKKI